MGPGAVLIQVSAFSCSVDVAKFKDLDVETQFEFLSISKPDQFSCRTHFPIVGTILLLARQEVMQPTLLLQPLCTSVDFHLLDINN